MNLDVSRERVKVILLFKLVLSFFCLMVQSVSLKKKKKCIFLLMYFICFYLLSFTAIVQNIYIDKMLQTNSKEQVLSAMATPTLKQTENEKKLDE